MRLDWLFVYSYCNMVYEPDKPGNQDVSDYAHVTDVYSLINVQNISLYTC